MIDHDSESYDAEEISHIINNTPAWIQRAFISFYSDPK